MNGINNAVVQVITQASNVRLTCWLELAEGGVVTLWSSKGLTGAEQGRCVARQ